MAQIQLQTRRLQYGAKTASYLLVDTDNVVTFDATSANLTASLPSAVGRSGQEFLVKKVDSSANIVTVDPAGTETIDGATTFVLYRQWDMLRLMSTGANWLVLIKPDVGLELTRGQITANASVTGTLADVSGLSVTFIAPGASVKVLVQIPYFNVGTNNGYMQVDITDGANTVVQTAVCSVAVATSSFAQLRAELVLASLTPGTSYTYKARAIVGGGATAGTIFANAAYPAYIQALSC